MRNSMSGKCSISLLLVVMVATLLACGAAFADPFNGITASPSSAAAGTTVSISFQANLTQLQHPIVRVNGHDATYSSSFQNKYFSYRYTIRTDDPTGWASIYISGLGGTVTNTTALQVPDTTPPTFTCTGTPFYAKGGTVVTLEVVASEALSYPPTVGVCDWRDNTYTYADYFNTNGNTYYYHYTVETDAPEGNTPVTVWGWDVAGNQGKTEWLLPYFVDTTAPVVSNVTDEGDYATSNTQLSASWTSSDGGSGVSENFYAIGTTPGSNDVVDWTSTGLQTSATATGLSLSSGVTYYFSVKASDRSGNFSEPESSNGITLPEPPTFTCVANPYYVYPGQQVTLAVTASQPLQWPATVGIYDYRDGSWDYANWYGTNGNTYYYLYTVPTDAASGHAQVSAWGCNLQNVWGSTEYMLPYFVEIPE